MALSGIIKDIKTKTLKERTVMNIKFLHDQINEVSSHSKGALDLLNEIVKIKDSTPEYDENEDSVEEAIRLDNVITQIGDKCEAFLNQIT